jgi:hypothetical protein
MRALFALIIDLVSPYSENGAGDVAATWSERWVRMFRRKTAVEESLSGEQAVLAAMEIAKMEVGIAAAREQKEEEEFQRVKQEREEEDRRRREAQEAEDKAREEVEAGKVVSSLGRDEEMDGEQANGGAQQFDVAEDDDL